MIYSQTRVLLHAEAGDLDKSAILDLEDLDTASTAVTDSIAGQHTGETLQS